MEPARPAGLTRSLEAALHRTCATVIRLVELTREGFARLDRHALVQAEEVAGTLRRDARALGDGILSEISRNPGFVKPARALLALPMHIERMADRGDALTTTLRTLVLNDLPVTERARAEVQALMDATLEVLGALRDQVRTWNPILARHVVEAADRAEARTDECAQQHRDRLVGGECVPRSASHYLAVLDHLSSIRRHAREMALDLERWTRPSG